MRTPSLTRTESRELSAGRSGHEDTCWEALAARGEGGGGGRMIRFVQSHGNRPSCGDLFVFEKRSHEMSSGGRSVQPTGVESSWWQRPLVTG